MRVLALLPLLLAGTMAAPQDITLPVEPTEVPETDNCPACTTMDTAPPCSPAWLAAAKACQEPPCNRRFIQDPLVAAGCGKPDLSGTSSAPSPTETGEANPEVPYPMPTITGNPEETGGSMTVPEGSSTVGGSMTIPEGSSTGSPILTPEPTPTGNGTQPQPTQPDGSAAGKVGLSMMALVPVIVAGFVFAA